MYSCGLAQVVDSPSVIWVVLHIMHMTSYIICHVLQAMQDEAAYAAS